MERNSAIDCIRVFAIISVIFMHVEGMGIPYAVFAKLISHSGQFAVVFFMVIAGYLWGKKIRAGNAVGSIYAGYTCRILTLFLLWSLLYLVIPRNTREISYYLHAVSHYGVLSLIDVPYRRLLGVVEEQGGSLRGALYIFLTGTKYHLWFLMALAWASTITATMVKWKRESLLMWVGACFYAFEVLSRLLSAASPDFSLPFNARYGPFFGTIFFALGWRLSSRRRPFGLTPAIALLSGGFALLAVDILVIRNPFGSVVLEPFLETTVGVGFVLLALASPSLGGGTILASLGQYTLGIYVMHPLFIDLFMPFAHYIPRGVRDLAIPAVVFLFSALAAIILQKNRVLGRFVATSRTKGFNKKGSPLPGHTQPDELVYAP